MQVLTSLLSPLQQQHYVQLRLLGEQLALLGEQLALLGERLALPRESSQETLCLQGAAAVAAATPLLVLNTPTPICKAATINHLVCHTR